MHTAAATAATREGDRPRITPREDRRPNRTVWFWGASVGREVAMVMGGSVQSRLDETGSGRGLRDSAAGPVPLGRAPADVLEAAEITDATRAAPSLDAPGEPPPV